MKEADVVVIGGSAAGITAAKTCRKHYPEKNVLLVRKEEQVPIPCGIPYVFGTVDSPQKNIIPDKALESDDIDFITDEATDIDKDEKKVLTSSGEKISYDKLVLATGSSPVKPPISGIDKENVYTVLKDVSLIEELIESMNEAKDLVIIGGGFIGIEFADECRKNKNLNVTVVEMLPHCLMLGGFDKEFCEKAEKKIEESGVQLLTEKKVDAILGEEKATGVKFSDGGELNADVVLVAVGAKPNVELAKKAELELGENGGVNVNRHMRTSDEDIFACGDCARKVSFFTGAPEQVMLASIACMEARIAGSNLFGVHRENPGQAGIYSTKIGDLALASAGLSERVAKEKGYNVATGSAKAANRHPGVMPGMKETEVKLIFNKDTEVIIGGQIAGGFSAGEMINTIGSCIQAKMTANDIATLQVGTHPALTASPIAYQLPNAAEAALQKIE